MWSKLSTVTGPAWLKQFEIKFVCRIISKNMFSTVSIPVAVVFEIETVSLIDFFQRYIIIDELYRIINVVSIFV